MARVEKGLESLEGFPVLDISGIALVNKDPGYHEICNEDGDNYGVVLVDVVDSLDVPIRKGDERKTLL